jgi:hypothetical protein
MATQNINPNEESSQSQCKMIAAWLMQGKSITFPEALNMFGCARLASRINDLKNRGMNIDREMIVTPYTNKRVARYFLVKNNK